MTPLQFLLFKGPKSNGTDIVYIVIYYFGDAAWTFVFRHAKVSEC